MVSLETGLPNDDFTDKVKLLIKTVNERELLFNALRKYQQNLDLAKLVDDLKDVLNEPSRIELYESIRPLIPLNHQLKYDYLAPRAPGDRLRVIRLQRFGGEGLGFSVRGGLEHGVGVYVSQVTQGSQANLQGLRVGDELVRVNGFTISQAIHEEVLNLIRAKNEIILKVRSIGMLPSREQTDNSVIWKYVEQIDSNKALQQVLDGNIPKTNNRSTKLFVSLAGATGLGCSICTGPPHLAGIFIQSVKQGSLAKEVGLEIGDQLLEVNGTSFYDIDHAQAVVALKGTKQLNITVKKGAGLLLFPASKQQTLSPQDQLEADKLQQLRGIAIDKGREQLKHEDREGKILEEDRKKMEDKLKEEEAELEKNQARKDKQAQLERQEKENLRRQEETKRQMETEARENQREVDRKKQQEDELAKQKAEEERKRRQQKQKQEGDRLAREAKEKQEKERAEAARKKEEDRKLKQRKYMEKEQELLRSFKKQNVSLERATKLRLQRHIQDEEEIQRESERFSTETGELWSGFRMQKPVVLGSERSSNKTAPKALTGNANAKSKSADVQVDNEKFDPKKLFTSAQIDGRQIRQIKIRKDGPLDFDLEGGLGSVLGDRVIVSDIFEGGSVYKQGGIHKGDQVMMADGKSLLGLTLDEAEAIIGFKMKGPQEIINLVIAVAPPKNYEDEVTYF